MQRLSAVRGYRSALRDAVTLGVASDGRFVHFITGTIPPQGIGLFIPTIGNAMQGWRVSGILISFLPLGKAMKPITARTLNDVIESSN